MGDIDKLRRLLDGDVDHGDLAKNPMLASIAERAYGVSVKPMRMSKPSQFEVTAGESVIPSHPSGPIDPINLMVEVIEGIEPPPISDSHKMPQSVTRNGGRAGLIFWPSLMLLVTEITNLFGIFGMLFGDICVEPGASTGTCPDQGATRINLLSIGELDSGWAWSEPLQAGGFGIPDIVMVVALLFLCVVMKKRK
jgi:hypothetical protein